MPTKLQIKVLRNNNNLDNYFIHVEDSKKLHEIVSDISAKQIVITKF